MLANIYTAKEMNKLAISYLLYTAKEMNKL